MSICNMFVTPDHALVAVDTATANFRDPENPVYSTGQKAMIHGDVLVASRGGLGLPQILHEVLIEACQFWRTDDMQKQLPSLLAHAQNLYKQVLAGGKETPVALAREHEVYVVGWSERLQRIKGVVATQKQHGWQIDEITSYCVAPGLPGVTADDLSTQAAMKATALRQIAAFKDVDPAAPIGGELMLYQIMRDGMIVRKLGAIQGPLRR